MTREETRGFPTATPCELLRSSRSLPSESFFASLSRINRFVPVENGGCDESYSGSFLRSGRHVPAPASIFAIPPDGTMPQRLAPGVRTSAQIQELPPERRWPVSSGGWRREAQASSAPGEGTGDVIPILIRRHHLPHPADGCHVPTYVAFYVTLEPALRYSSRKQQFILFLLGEPSSQRAAPARIEPYRLHRTSRSFCVQEDHSRPASVSCISHMPGVMMARP